MKWINIHHYKYLFTKIEYSLKVTNRIPTTNTFKQSFSDRFNTSRNQKPSYSPTLSSYEPTGLYQDTSSTKTLSSEDTPTKKLTSYTSSQNEKRIQQNDIFQRLLAFPNDDIPNNIDAGPKSGQNHSILDIFSII